MFGDIDEIKMTTTVEWRLPGVRVELLRSYAVRDYTAYHFIIGHPGERTKNPPTTVPSGICGAIEKQASPNLYSVMFCIMLKHNEFANIKLLCHKDDFRQPEAKIYDMEKFKRTGRG